MITLNSGKEISELDARRGIQTTVLAACTPSPAGYSVAKSASADISSLRRQELPAGPRKRPLIHRRRLFVIAAVPETYSHGFGGACPYRRQAGLDDGSQGSTRAWLVGQAEPTWCRCGGGSGGSDVWIARIYVRSSTFQSRGTTEQHRRPRRSSAFALRRSDTTQGIYFSLVEAFSLSSLHSDLVNSFDFSNE